MTSNHEPFSKVNLTSVAGTYFEGNIERGDGNDEVILSIP